MKTAKKFSSILHPNEYCHEVGFCTEFFRPQIYFKHGYFDGYL